MFFSARKVVKTVLVAVLTAVTFGMLPSAQAQNRVRNPISGIRLPQPPRPTALANVRPHQKLIGNDHANTSSLRPGLPPQSLIKPFRPRHPICPDFQSGTVSNLQPPVMVGPPVESGSGEVIPETNAGNTTAEQAEPNAETAMLITKVERGPAARAGLQDGDVILELNGKRATSASVLRKLLSEAGETVEIVYFNSHSRQFEKKTVAVVDGTIGIQAEEVTIKSGK